jgi:hypothetical protein
MTENAESVRISKLPSEQQTFEIIVNNLQNGLKSYEELSHQYPDNLVLMLFFSKKLLFNGKKKNHSKQQYVQAGFFW